MHILIYYGRSFNSLIKNKHRIRSASGSAIANTKITYIKYNTISIGVGIYLYHAYYNYMYIYAIYSYCNIPAVPVHSGIISIIN